MAAHLTPEQLKRAIDLQSRGWTQTRIASELGVDQSTVSRSLSRLNRRAMKRLEKQSAETKAKHVQILDRIVEESLAQWERSKLSAETIKQTEMQGSGEDDKGFSKTETTVKGQTGEPALLREARGALADVRKILGLDAPPAKPSEPFDLSQLTAEAEHAANEYSPEERPRPNQGSAGEVP